MTWVIMHRKPPTATSMSNDIRGLYCWYFGFTSNKKVKRVESRIEIDTLGRLHVHTHYDIDTNGISTGPSFTLWPSNMWSSS